MLNGVELDFDERLDVVLLAAEPDDADGLVGEEAEDEADDDDVDVDAEDEDEDADDAIADPEDGKD
jgi:hypothetical protein